MIQVNSLTKEYAGRRAISDVSFSVKRGEVLGFLGPNGAGKTTTMRILTGFLPPTSGSASVAGFDVETESLQARRHIGYLPESVPLYRELKVYDYLDFIAQLRGIPSADRPEKIGKAIERLNLGSVADRYIGKLSKGYRQRVGIAQAVMHEPDVMILDEPTEGLDPRQRTETRALIRELGKEHTVILSTHILPEVEATCDRVLIISEGRIVASDTPEGLSTTLKRGQRLEVLVRAEEDHVRLALQGIAGITRISSQDLPEERRRVDIEGLPDIELRHLVAKSLVNADIDLFEIHAEAISLEDIFLQLTTSDPDNRDDEAPSARERDTSTWATERAAGEVGQEDEASLPAPEAEE